MQNLPLIDDPAELNKIYTDIEARVMAAREAKPVWPCKMGCDACCRRLAQPMMITAAEWHTFKRGIEQLPTAIQEQVSQKILALAEWEAGHIVCPLLDEDKGMCRVYDHRPAACRMYGYYVAKHNNQWCELVEALSHTGELEGVMLGNYSAITRKLCQQFGEQQSIDKWLILTPL